MKMRVIQLLLVVSLVFLNSCSSKSPEPAERLKAPTKPLSCILVMPSQTSIELDSSLPYENAKELRDGADFMNSELDLRLRGYENVRIVKFKEIEPYLTEIKGGMSGLIRVLGEKLNCQAMLFSTVSKFKQREGSDWAVDAPASVAFDMQLIATENGSVLWSATFNETQQPLFSNIFSWGKAEKRGFKFVTVQDLTRQGLDERLENCPYF